MQDNQQTLDVGGAYEQQPSDARIQALYVEALYTIFHKVGSSTLPESTLVDYVRMAMQIDERRHGELMARARKEKVSVDMRSTFESLIHCSLQS